MEFVLKTHTCQLCR